MLTRYKLSYILLLDTNLTEAEKMKEAEAQARKVKDGFRAFGEAVNQMFANNSEDLPLAILESLRYNPLTGSILWRKSSGTRKARTRAGSKTAKGYTRIQINGARIMAHRVAWFLHYGAWPSLEIDHIDRDRSNNRINNLREVTRSQNLSNRNPYKHTKCRAE